MNVRRFSIAAVGAFVVVSLATAAGSQAAQTKQVAKGTEMVPLIGISRVTSPDRSFIVHATQSAIVTMNASQSEIDSSRQGNVQGEAVRAFNSAAFAYNSLADIALERRIDVASPSSIFRQDTTPNPIDGAPIVPSDLQYLNVRPETLQRTIAIYATEVKYGHDPVVVSFAKQMKARLEHDLVLATLDLKALESGGYGDRPAETVGSSTMQ